MSRRDSNDADWQDIKKKVRVRDKNTDRILKILTVKEFLILMKLAPHSMLETLDPAHVYPVSTHPQLTYYEDNLVLLNRYSHENLDSMRDPVLARPVSHEVVMDWWERILGPEQWGRLQAQLNPPSLDSN